MKIRSPSKVAEKPASLVEKRVAPASRGVTSWATESNDDVGLLAPSQRLSMSRACELMIARDHRAPGGREQRRRMAKLARKLGVKK